MTDDEVKLREAMERPQHVVPLTEPVPLIRCTMPVPCGVCWYCLMFVDASRPQYNGTVKL